MQFLSFAASVQAPSHPPGVVADMDIRTVLNSDILQPVVGQYTVAKLICNDGCVVLVNKGTAALLR